MGGSPAGQRAFFFPPAGESAASPQRPSRTTKARTGARTQVQTPVPGGKPDPQVLITKCSFLSAQAAPSLGGAQGAHQTARRWASFPSKAR